MYAHIFWICPLRQWDAVKELLHLQIIILMLYWHDKLVHDLNRGSLLSSSLLFVVHTR